MLVERRVSNRHGRSCLLVRLDLKHGPFIVNVAVKKLEILQTAAFCKEVPLYPDRIL